MENFNTWNFRSILPTLGSSLIDVVTIMVHSFRDSHSKIIYVPGGHTDGIYMCPEEILCAQVNTETWIVQKVFKISSQHEDHSLTFSKSFPMIPNMWHFDQYEDDF